MRIVPPLAVLLGALGLWEGAVALFDLPAYLLPAPSDVARAAGRRPGQLLEATGLTAAGAVCGLLLSLVVGTVVAFAFSQSQLVRRSFYPYAIFLQTVPIVAIAPLVVIWVGTGFPSVVLVAFVVSLFPIITNGTTGLLRVDPGLLELFRTLGASRWQTLARLRLPHAVPYLVTGARVSSGLSVIGAIVGEFFVGYGSDTYSLGYLILMTSQQLQTDLLFASILASTLLGLAIFEIVGWAGAAVLRIWPSAAEPEPTP